MAFHPQGLVNNNPRPDRRPYVGAASSWQFVEAVSEQAWGLLFRGVDEMNEGFDQLSVICETGNSRSIVEQRVGWRRPALSL